MSGYHKMPRGWMDMPALGGDREPLCRRAAWVWLIENAIWQDRKTVPVAGKAIDLLRGQMSFSLRFMARAWGWEEPRVRRFLKRLQEGGEIKICSDAAQNIITICKYCEYSFQNDENDAAATQQRRSSDAKIKEGIKEEERKKVSVPQPAVAATAVRAESAPSQIPVPNARTQLFQDGLAQLRRLTGKSESQARGMLGMLCRDAKDNCAKVVEKLAEAESLRPVEPFAWLRKAVSPPPPPVLLRPNGEPWPISEFTGKPIPMPMGML